MGCCLSRDGGGRAVKQPPLAALKPPSPPEKEVETVKEILTQTPTHPTTKPAAETVVHKPDNASCDKASKPGRVVEYETSPERPKSRKLDEAVAEAKSFKSPAADEVSDASECYSYNESRSTTTVTEIRDDEDEGEVNTSQARQRMKTRRPQRNTQTAPFRPPHHPQRTRNAAVSSPKPRRETSQSPARRPNPQPQPRRAGFSESPVRRPMRVNGPRPTRPGPLSPKRVEYGRMEESLENPLVSLECFIFL
uniref:Uncharacterized protein n=1 Tax=Kalanchoe fedtschenkoi TaxID=63787 RepID=A0A7N0TK47_KALFE